MRRRRFRTLGRYASVLAVGLVLAFPILYLMSASLMSTKDLNSYPPKLFPSQPVWENFAAAAEYLTPVSVLNSLLFSVGVVALQLALALPAGFALAKVPFRFATPIMAVLVLSVFLPANMALIPTYVITHTLGLVNTYAGLILPVAGGTAMAMLMFRQFFAGMPSGLFEAARLDGAGWIQSFLRIALPLSGPIVAAYSVVTFLAVWNMYVWPQVVAPSENLRVLTVALAPLARSDYSQTPPGVGMAAAVISMLPVLVVFLLFQRSFRKGIVGTGLE